MESYGEILWLSDVPGVAPGRSTSEVQEKTPLATNRKWGLKWRRGESNQADKPLANLQTSHRATQNPTQAVADPILAELTAIWPLLAEIDRRHLLALAEQTLAESVFGPEDSHDSL